MSEEVAIMALVKTAPGKLERFKEVTDAAIARIEAEEPETLQFVYYEQQTEDGPNLMLFERYTNKAAMEKHEASPQYQQFFKTIMEEGLLDGPPVLHKGKLGKALSR